MISGKSTFPSVEISYCKQVPICTIYFAIVATIMTTTMEKPVSSILASKFDIIGMIFISSMGIKIDVCPTYLVP